MQGYDFIKAVIFEEGLNGCIGVYHELKRKRRASQAGSRNSCNTEAAGYGAAGYG